MWSLQPHCILPFQPAIQIHQVDFMDQMFSGEEGYLSSHSKCFCNLAIVLPTWLNSNLFQSSNLTLHRSKHVLSEKSEPIAKPSSHASWTTSTHWGSFNHIDSNRKTRPTFHLWVLIYLIMCITNKVFKAKLNFKNFKKIYYKSFYKILKNTTIFFFDNSKFLTIV